MRIYEVDFRYAADQLLFESAYFIVSFNERKFRRYGNVQLGGHSAVVEFEKGYIVGFFYFLEFIGYADDFIAQGIAVDMGRVRMYYHVGGARHRFFNVFFGQGGYS